MSGAASSGGRHRGRHRAADRVDDPTEPIAGPRVKKSSRNLPQALGVGVLLGALALAPLLWYPPGFVALVVVAVVMAVREFTSVLHRKGVQVPAGPLMLGGAGTVCLVWFTGAEALLIGLVLTLIAALLWRLAEGPVGFARDITAAVFVTCYVPLLAGFVVLLLAPSDGMWRVLAFIVTTICSDTGGFIAGSLFGRHKLAPTVSPNKTWEGFAGSLTCCLVSGVCFLVFALDGSWWQGAVFGAVVCCAATLGDLAESLLKRDLGVKDMGSVLPGHGGFMDRFDSLLVAAPVAYAALTLFVVP